MYWTDVLAKEGSLKYRIVGGAGTACAYEFHSRLLQVSTDRADLTGAIHHAELERHGWLFALICPGNTSSQGHPCELKPWWRSIAHSQERAAHRRAVDFPGCKLRVEWGWQDKQSLYQHPCSSCGGFPIATCSVRRTAARIVAPCVPYTGERFRIGTRG